MAAGSNNPPHAIIELTEKQHAFLLKNCEQNMELALSVLMTGDLSHKSAEKIVTLNEQFKEIRELLRKAVQ